VNGQLPIFDTSARFDPDGDFEAFLAAIPARWVVYFMADEQDRPVQLLCVKNLRSSLKRRLGGDEQIGPSKRIRYRDLVRNVHWRRVDSAFEADWVYLEAARQLFPDTCQGMIRFRSAFFIHVDPDAPFPRYIKTTSLDQPAGLLIGPLEDKHAAARLMQLAEDAFDLCRYYNILIQAPHGQACAYKEMGKCPAPCDGSISMEAYRRSVADSAAAIIDPARFIGAASSRMQREAQALQFEAAARSKARLEQLARLGKGGFRHARRLDEFVFLSLQRGPRAQSAKAFLITPRSIRQLACLMARPAHGAELLRLALESAAAELPGPITPVAAERIALVSQHLFSAKGTHGVFLRLSEADEKDIIRAFQALQKQKVEDQAEGEGVVRV
jgi:excinuclease UvrABC nuclease subunit